MGNLLSILDHVVPAENRTHTYDALQRLKTGWTTVNVEAYTYDLVGNWTTSFLSTTHTFDNLNRLLEDDSFTYIYDNTGNMAMLFRWFQREKRERLRIVGSDDAAEPASGGKLPGDAG